MDTTSSLACRIGLDPIASLGTHAEHGMTLSGISTGALGDREAERSPPLRLRSIMGGVAVKRYDFYSIRARSRVLPYDVREEIVRAFKRE